MSILGKTTTHRFIARHWQKEPLLVRQACPLPTPLIDANELAGLACEDEVESRLVLCDAQLQHWHCEDGPFDDERFAELPPSHWTLLVQGVDQHEPLIKDLLDHFTFLPRWRVDDIMLSYAVDGGGVGAHFDLYDVFLLQLQGTRRWRLGQRCDEHTPLRTDVPLKLLSEFHAREEYQLEAGDMLYLPPGLAHWGTALGDDCVTASIGYRSPSPRALAERTLEVLAASMSDNPGYRDSPQAIDADPFRINRAAMTLARKMCDELTAHRISQALERAFGAQVTEPRQTDLIDNAATLATTLLDARISAAIKNDEPLRLEHHRASRFAYADSDDDAESWTVKHTAHRSPWHAGSVTAICRSAPWQPRSRSAATTNCCFASSIRAA
jgi:50S ribosomal protein L16 3-hydroxylase